MKLQKINTSSFAISKKIEEDAEKKAESNQRLRLHKRYMTLGRFTVVKTKGENRGLLFKKKTSTIKRNNIYVDLTYLNIVYLNPAGILRKQTRIDKTDILRKVINFSPMMLNTLNYVWEHGNVRYDGLDKESVIELAKRGLVVVYEPSENQLLNIIKIIADERTITSYSVRSNFYLPKITDKRYDLSNYLEQTETIDESYERDPIRHSIKRIEEVLSQLFNCEASLEEITYIPYILFEYVDSTGAEAQSIVAVCLKGSNEAKRGYKTELKLAPISLGTDLYDESLPLERSTISFEELGGLQKAKNEILESVIYPLIRPDLSKKFGKKSGGGILLYGPPGCGKTQLARAAVTECGVSFFNVNVSDILNESGNEAKRLHEVFEQVAKNSPAIIFFDEIDALCSRKASTDESKKKVLNQFLMDMSGLEKLNEGVLVMAATNVPWELDPALRRAGRFTKQIYIPPPDLQARVQIFKIFTRGRPLNPGIDFIRLGELTEGYSGADIEEVCNIAASLPWRDALKGGKERNITMNDFIAAIREHKSSLIAWSLSAEELIKKSGEEFLYKDLLETVRQINRFFIGNKKPSLEDAIKQKIKELDIKELRQLNREKIEIEEKMELLKEKHIAGKIGDDIYLKLMKDYGDRLIEVELKIKNLKSVDV